MSNRVNIHPKAMETIIRHAKNTFPNECCGFLYGKDSVIRSIEEAIPVKNSKEGDQRRRFEISPLDYVKAEQYAELNGTCFLGIYHSHPNHPAIASSTDLEKAMPYFSYVIVSIIEGYYDDVKSWRLKESEHVFEEEYVSIRNIESSVTIY